MNKKNNELTSFPIWFDSKNYVTEETKEHTEIAMFYVMNYPDSDQNKKAKLLEEFGWSGNDLVKLFNSFCQNNGIAIDDLITTDTDNLIQELHRMNLVNLVNDDRQRGVIHKKLSDVQSILLILRNALAHGTYIIQTLSGDAYYLLENRMPLINTNGKLRGRLYIKQNSLINLISLIKDGPKKEEQSEIKRKCKDTNDTF